VTPLGVFDRLPVYRYVWGSMALWTLVVGAFFAWNLADIFDDTRRLAESEARASFNKDQAFRHWATMHGGVYVPVTEHTQPNPYLAHVPERDIQTPSGKRLTLMNPAYMVRQLNEDFAPWFGAKGHITSLKLLRPENVADAWERAALQRFELGEQEVSEITDIDGEPYLRLMRPMITQEGCLKCHGHQGYKVGDIRGGVSVSIPMARFLAAERDRLRRDSFSFGALWLLGLAGLWGGGRRLMRHEDARRRAEEALQASERKFRGVFDDALDMIHIVDANGRILDANRMQLTTLGYSADELIGRSLLEIVHPDYRDKTQDALTRVFQGEHITGFETVLLTRQGEELTVETNVVPETAGGRVLSARAIARDITARRQAEATLHRVNRALITLSSGNESLVRARSEPELLQSICDVLVQHGGYRFAWVGYAQHDATRAIRPVAHAGTGGDYLASVTHGWQDNEAAEDPIGAAITRGTTQLVRDIAGSSSPAPWRRAALEQDCGSMVAIPLRRSAAVFGVLAIYSAKRDAFAADEVRLLEELAGDLAYGVRMLRIRAERDAANRALSEVLMQTVDAIALTVEKRDPYTAGHQHRVAELAIAIAGKMGLEPHRIEGLRLGAILHDLGKIAIPAELLSRPGRLTEAEFGLIKNHPRIGHEIIKGVHFPWPVKEMILQHHERLDGSGYPQGLKDPEIVLEARIIAVADVVEAITSHRPYRPALGIDTALEEIQSGRGTLYDPAVVDHCVALFTEEGFRWQTR